MAKFIIITSIYEPSAAILKYASLADYTLVVVGDHKTPPKWGIENAIYVSVADQQHLGYEIIKKLPYNSYCRKLIGYLYAIEKGAEVIIDTDDDNIPYDGWDFPLFEGRFDTLNNDIGFVNLYSFFTDEFIWPRGFPLPQIRTSQANINRYRLREKQSKIGIWQGLADGDPDVDAIFRLLYDERIIFSKRPPVVLGEGTVCPFNSQNTAFIKWVFPLLYLPAFVNFRFTDILRGLVAQPILWKHGFKLGFVNATVYQQRNEHSLMDDFQSEIPCYLFADKIINVVRKSLSVSGSIEDDLLQAYEALAVDGIVERRELDLLQSWLSDLNKLTHT